MVEHLRERCTGGRVGEIVAFEQCRGLRARRGGDRLQGIGIRPVAHNDHSEAGRVVVYEVLSRALAQMADDAGEQDRALANATRAVQKRQPRAKKVRGNDPRPLRVRRRRRSPTPCRA